MQTLFEGSNYVDGVQWWDWTLGRWFTRLGGNSSGEAAHTRLVAKRSLKERVVAAARHVTTRTKSESKWPSPLKVDEVAWLFKRMGKKGRDCTVFFSLRLKMSKYLQGQQRARGGRDELLFRHEEV